MKHSFRPGPYILINTFAPGSRHWDFLPAMEHHQRIPTVPPQRALRPDTVFPASSSLFHVLPEWTQRMCCTLCHFIFLSLYHRRRNWSSHGLCNLSPGNPARQQKNLTLRSPLLASSLCSIPQPNWVFFSFIYFWINRLYIFREILASQQNWEESTRSSHMPPVLPTTSLRIIHVHHKSGTFITTDKATLKYRYHPKPIVYASVHSWCHTFCGFWWIYNIYPPL